MRTCRNVAFLLLAGCLVTGGAGTVGAAPAGFCEDYSCNCDPIEADPPNFCAANAAFQCTPGENFCWDHWIACYYFCYQDAGTYVWDEWCNPDNGGAICKCACPI